LHPAKAILSLLFVFVCSSCSSGKRQEQASTDIGEEKISYDNSLSKGKVIDTVVCKADNSQSYALYLPSYYTAEKQFPVIFFFDAHARGSLPIHLYKGLAEKYGYIFASSNISQNGMAWDATHRIAKTMMEDARSRMNINASRVYLSGFSGGSRVASSIAIEDGGIAGVIGCSAGFPEVKQAIQHKFDYVGIAGEYDFNWAEMEQLDNTLEQNAFTHQLLTFAGIHNWPPFADFESALLWIQMNAIKEHLQPANDTLIKKFKNNFDKRIASANSDLIKKQQLLDGIVKTLSGLADVSVYQKQLAELTSSTAYKQAIALQNQLQQQEPVLQQELSKQFATQNVQWWTNKIAELNKNIKTARPQQVSLMYRRVLSYLGLICYLYTDHALTSGDLANAENYLEIFKMADPKNPDVPYLTAIYFAKKGNNKMAIASLKGAAQMGYNDIGKLRTEAAFNSLHEDTAFFDIEKMALEGNKR
jgi:hypothetical protein